jgi:serine/threonine protein phosphatase 1
MLFRRFLSPSPVPAARGPEGWRAYVVGDIHGCLPLLDRLLEEIGADHRSRPPARGLLAFLGDYVDRGPGSAGVIERLRGLDLPDFRVVALAGNHEEVFTSILEGDGTQVAGWLKFGGAEALRSYGVDPKEIARLAPADAQKRIRSAVPSEHRSWLGQLADSFRFGDYLFVHAGIRPGVPLEAQSLTDLRWIREPFLSDRRDHGMVVVHGHTICERVQRSGWRIGIDTGAYATGRLTALAIEEGQSWLIDTIEGRRELEPLLA